MPKIASILLAVTGLIVSLSYAFSQYIRVKEHDLNVVSQVRLCVKDLGDSNEGDIRYCISAASKTYILESVRQAGIDAVNKYKEEIKK